MLQKEGFYLTLLATKMVTLSAVYQGLTMRWGWVRCAISPQQTVEGALHNESHFTGKDTEAQKNERSCARPLGQSRDQSPGLPESGVCALRDHSALPTALLVGQTGDGARRQEDMEGENGCFLALLYPPSPGVVGGRGVGWWQERKAVTWGHHQEPLLSHCLIQYLLNLVEECAMWGGGGGGGRCRGSCARFGPGLVEQSRLRYLKQWPDPISVLNQHGTDSKTTECIIPRG